MLKTLGTEHAAVTLAHLGAVRVQGADALRFLQGQLSNDTSLLTAQRAQLAGLHTAQGRVIALVRLMVVGHDDVIAVLPRELAAPVAARLARYVLRAKVKVADASGDWRFHGLMAGDAGTAAPRTANAGAPGEESSVQAEGDERGALSDEVHSQSQDGTSFVVGVAHGRWLVASPAGEAVAVVADGAARVERWRGLDIAAGIPQVYAATSEAFVAQMLNLDALGAIAFDKGCYTGQEIIARAHYRGRVKRRMQRFRTRSATSLTAGDAIQLNDGRSARVVEAIALGDGRHEFLAVTNLGASDDPIGAAEAPAAPAQTAVDVESLPLPYALPD